MFAKKQILKLLYRIYFLFLLICLQKRRGQTKGRDFREILGQRACEGEIVHKSFKQTDQTTYKGSLPTTDKYLAVFTEYSVVEYSSGHYSADRIVGRSISLI
jgi:hypothetical protein